MHSHDDYFALLITWTCYGTWLPGDRRGFVSNIRRVDGKYDPKHNLIGTPYTADHAPTREHAKAIQKFPTATLDRSLAHVVAQSLIESCAARNWRVLRAAIMWNHVHVVVCNCPDNGPEVWRILKGVSQNAISQFLGKPRRSWSAGGSDRYLHGERAITTAVQYVANQPDILAEIIDMSIVD